MAQLDLSEEEIKFLGNALENYLSHLRVEINGTYKREFREALRQRETALSAVFQRIKDLGTK